MIWVLMVIAGGYSYHSGIGIDMSQRFQTEEKCIVMRDNIRAVDAVRKTAENSPAARQRVTTECIGRPDPAGPQ